MQLRLTPELHPPVAPVILLQVDGDAHQPRHRAGLAAKARPVPVRFQKTVLRQRLGQVHVTSRREKKPEDLHTMLCDDSRKLLRRILLCGSYAHRYQCCAGCHHLGRRPHRLQVYSPRQFSSISIESTASGADSDAPRTVSNQARFTWAHSLRCLPGQEPAPPALPCHVLDRTDT